MTANAYFGAASASTTWVDAYAMCPIWEVTAVMSISPIGQCAGYFASRSSDNPTPGSAVITHTILTVADDTANAHTTWNQYIEGDILSTTSPHAFQHFNTESIVVNGWPATTADPFTPNPVGSTFAVRYGSGFGGRVSNTVTAGIHLVNETSNFSSGIIIGADALDTAVGRVAPALAMGPNHALTWYSGANTVSGKIYHDGNSLVIDAMKITLKGLPTIDPHADGQLWRNGNRLMISGG